MDVEAGLGLLSHGLEVGVHGVLRLVTEGGSEEENYTVLDYHRNGIKYVSRECSLFEEYFMKFYKGENSKYSL